MNKRLFKGKVIDIVLDAMKAYCNVNRHIETSMTSKNNGFYFKFHRYGEDLQILIYPDGSLGIKVREYTHDDQLSTYYVYCEEDAHEALLPTIQKDLMLLIQDFYNGMNYHTLADCHIDFTLLRCVPDWRDTYQQVRPCK